MAYNKMFCDELREMRAQSVLCDVKLAATNESQYFMAHSLVLAAHSQFFYRYFTSSETKIDSQHVFYVNGLNHEMLSVTLDFFYGIYPASQKGLENLKKGAELLEVSAAHKYLKSILMSGQEENILSSDVVKDTTIRDAIITHCEESVREFAENEVATNDHIATMAKVTGKFIFT